ncbi:MAG TPA: EscU/YscU/HrcU family type III secretion system export apparatus switch protein [Petrimonas sp.]|nr:EscU/YscU/HrcU family type III secretion system export apparatus switch protein [Petrimonas sp.]
MPRQSERCSSLQIHLWDFENNLKMSKQEIKEEYKQTEGNPQIKSESSGDCNQPFFAHDNVRSLIKDKDKK